MTYVLVLVMLALAFPWGAAPLARRLADALAPRAACWVLTGAAVALAGATVAVLVGLVHVPFLASLERLSLARVWEVWPVSVPFALAAGGALLVQLVLLVRRFVQHRSVLARAWQAAEQGDGGRRDEAGQGTRRNADQKCDSDGDLLVIPGDEIDAFALPSHKGRPARIVVTAGMLRSLKAPEREVLLAHERAHLTGRHHLLSAAVDLAAMTHPALRQLREALAYHLERWADEDAAAAVGDRRTAAAAIARAALAAASHGRTGGYPLLSATSGPVPRRVKALLGPEPTSPQGGAQRTAAAALAGTVIVAAVAAPVLAYELHEYVEYAAQQLVSPDAVTGCSDVWSVLRTLFGTGAP